MVWDDAGASKAVCVLVNLAEFDSKSWQVLLETTLMFLSGRILFMILTENYD